MQILPLINDSRALAAFCQQIETADFITVDTEFMRENTFWPELCLIQVAGNGVAAAIDPMARDLDMAPLMNLLTENEDVLKVFHAGGQDVEIIYNITGKTPHPIFDTQIGAMALSQAEQVGYSNMVESWLGIVVDKGARFTDWARRPLDTRQIDYAIADVTHLATIFPKMLDALMKKGRGTWLDEEMERLADPETYAQRPEDAWQRVKIPSRKPEVLGRLRALAAWRENEARQKNLPRGRIMKDETLADLANTAPRTQNDLARVRGLSAAWGNNDIGYRMMQALETAEPMARDDIPEQGARRQGPGKDGSLIADLLKLLLKIRARELNVASRLIARGDDLDAIACGVRENLSILRGWRYDIFGRDALDLVDGKLAFAVVNGRLAMTRSEGLVPDALETDELEPITKF